jgi:alkanesulfonate monooxygenase SsuD/methylene tetrahydromethanopterin reductase-like flavin-dependent oxidoreductase (luciferase family)
VYKVKASSVLRRIAKYGDGWISRAYTDLQSLSRDWRTLQNYMKEFGKDISRMTFAHITWMYLTEGKSEGTARELFSRCLSLPFEDIKKEAIIGSKPEIMKKIEELVNIDVTYLIIWPTGEDYELLKFLSKDVLASFT